MCFFSDTFPSDNLPSDILRDEFTWHHFGHCLVGQNVGNEQPSDAVRKQNTLLKIILSVQYSHNLKNITPLENSNLII